MHDSRSYRDNAAQCLLAAQEACQPYYRKLRLSMAVSWQSQLRSLSSDSEPTASSGDWALERLSSGLCVPRTPYGAKPQRDVSGGKDTEVLMDRLR